MVKRKFISLLLGLCLCAPVGQYHADATSAQPQPTLTAVEFDTPAANASQTAAMTLSRVSQMEKMLGALVLDAQSVSEGWSSQSDIIDRWSPIYLYINAYELGADNGWEHTEQGFVRIPADYIRQLFCDMYGQEYDSLPPVSRAYSSLIVYDGELDMYDITGADGDIRQAVLRALSIGADGSATVEYDIITGEDESAMVAAAARVYLEPGAPSTYGLKPEKLELDVAVG